MRFGLQYWQRKKTTQGNYDEPEKYPGEKIQKDKKGFPKGCLSLAIAFPPMFPARTFLKPHAVFYRLLFFV